MPTVHLIIKGKVQGVFYRATARKAANENGVTGWVQNTDDGNVEIIASASQDVLNKFVTWCREGPAMATVTTVEIIEKEEILFTDFTVKR